MAYKTSTSSPHPVRAYRDRHSLTARGFARIVGCGANTILWMEAGDLQPRLALVMRIAAATGQEVTPEMIVLWSLDNHRATSGEACAAG